MLCFDDKRYVLDDGIYMLAYFRKDSVTSCKDIQKDCNKKDCEEIKKDCDKKRRLKKVVIKKIVKRLKKIVIKKKRLRKIVIKKIVKNFMLAIG